MTFCGRCGSLLAPGAIKCPRCGTPVEPSDNAEEMHTDAPTIRTRQGNIPPEEGDYRTWQSISQQETSRMAGQNNYGDAIDTTRDPYHPPVTWEQTPPPQTPSYPAFPTGSSNTPHPQAGEIFYSTTSPTTDYPADPQFAMPSRTSKKTSAALILAIIAFVVAAALATTLFLAKSGELQPILQGHTATPTVPTPSPTTVTRTPEQQARTTIEQYFRDINNKDYRAAYNLWVPPPSTYNDFANGFAHTQRDDIQFGTITQQNDGTVQVPIIITALSDTGTKETYSGYYTVGQQPDDSWKITGANIKPGTGSIDTTLEKGFA